MREKYCNNCERVLAINAELQASETKLMNELMDTGNKLTAARDEVERYRHIVDEEAKEVERLKCENANLTLDLEWPVLKERDRYKAALVEIESLVVLDDDDTAQKIACNALEAD